MAKVQSKARKRDEPVRIQRLLDFDEVERLRTWALKAAAAGDREGVLVVTLLGTGGRRFEVAALRCDSVRMGPGGPEVYFHETKGGKKAAVPISNDTWKILEAWRKGRPASAPLIPTARGDGSDFMHPATLWRTFKLTLKRAGVTRNVGVHATRHAAGFLLLRATGDLSKVQHFLRHASFNTTATWYQHVHMPDVRAGLEKAGI